MYVCAFSTLLGVEAEACFAVCLQIKSHAYEIKYRFIQNLVQIETRSFETDVVNNRKRICIA
jgi:hypothetical protein